MSPSSLLGKVISYNKIVSLRYLEISMFMMEMTEDHEFFSKDSCDVL